MNITDAKRNALITQLQKLREMTEANGCTESEAMTASTKAQTLMKQYGLTLDEIKAATVQDDLCEQGEFSAGDRKTMHEVQFVGMRLGEYTNCKIWKDGSKLFFFGMSADVQIAKYLLGVFHTAMETEFSKYWKIEREFSQSHGRTARKAFMLGMASRLRERLKMLIEARVYESDLESPLSDSRQLVLVKDQIVSKAFSKLNMNLRKSRTVRSNDHNSYAAGKSAGNNVTISHGGLNGRSSIALN